MEEKKQCSKSWDGVRCTNKAEPGSPLCEECRIKVLRKVARIQAERQERDNIGEGRWPVENQVAF